MIGPKKLSTIRQELEQALAGTGEDPIRWLEERVTARRHRNAAVSGGSEVFDSLRRFLDATPREERKKRRVSAKK
jgi:hypothetical protein